MAACFWSKIKVLKSPKLIYLSLNKSCKQNLLFGNTYLNIGIHDDLIGISVAENVLLTDLKLVLEQHCWPKISRSRQNFQDFFQCYDFYLEEFS